jgi:NodT family efflux transporter outer membrane factor (OMF) lipoprotein
MPSPTIRRLASAVSLLALSACTVGPDYLRPFMEVPVAYKETKVVRQKGWKTAQPRDALDRGAWWTLFRDPMLNTLASQVEISNQSLKAAEANWRVALAAVRGDAAELFPSIGVTDSAVRTGTGGGYNGSGRTRVANQFRQTGTLSWEIDFWGRIRRQVESASADAQASQADLANARLSAQAALATAYFNLRATDERKQLLDETVAAYRRSAEIVRNQREAGIASEADVALAETQLRSAEASAIATGINRAQYEHAIAVLIGKAPAQFGLKPGPRRAILPAIPVGMPSELLERRPDIAAAERSVAAANAQIGVAEAAWFPTVSLSASVGTTSAVLSGLFKASNGFWSVGPTMAATLFDAGKRQAAVDQATAAHDAAVATYRQTVLTAFQGVEDNLASLNVLGRQIAAQEGVVASSEKAVELTMNQYKAGTLGYSNVVSAQATAQSAKETLISLKTQRLIAAVDLIVGLGGGWDASKLAVASTQ